MMKPVPIPVALLVASLLAAFLTGGWLFSPPTPSEAFSPHAAEIPTVSNVNARYLQGKSASDFLLRKGGKVNGDLSQGGRYDGLVKAAVHADCAADQSAIYHSFNAVNGTAPTIGGDAQYPGTCEVHFGFNVEPRFASATLGSPGSIDVVLFGSVAYVETKNLNGTPLQGAEFYLLIY